MKILGIDPGYDRLGIAVLEKPDNKTDAKKYGGKNNQKKETLLFSSCFSTSKKETIYARLLKIGKEISTILDEFTPDALAIETLFITKNQKTAMRVSEARGIIMYEAIKRNIPVFEYSPMQIKMAVTGDGSSDKIRITKMVRVLVSMKPLKTIGKKSEEALFDDEYDAIAVALTHAAMYRDIHSHSLLQK